MFSKRGIILMVLIGLLISLLALYPTGAQAQKHEKVALTLLGAKLGSDAQNFSHALGDIVGKNHPWLRVSVVETLGAVDNTKTMADLSADKRRLHVSQSIDPVLNLALNGAGPFKSIGKITGWRALFTLYNTSTHFMTLDQKIKDPKKDFVGKKIGLVPKGHGLSRAALFVLYDCWDLKGKVKVIHMPMGMLKDALIDGTIDIVVSGGMYFSRDDFKCSPFNEAILAARKNVRFNGLTLEEFERGMAKPPPQPFTLGPVNANALRPGYPDKDWGVLRSAFTWYVWEDFDEQVAYELVKTAAENAQKFKEYFAGGKAANLESFVANSWKESRYHPGALKFYKEKGIIPKGTL